jgi:hypothetical protein
MGSRIVIERSPWQDFFEELPKLLLQYQMMGRQEAHDEMMLEKKYALEAGLRLTQQKYQQSQDLYKENKALSLAYEQDFEKKKDNIYQLGISLDAIEDYNSTHGSKQLIANTQKPELDNYNELAEHYSSQSEYWKESSAELSDLLASGIHRAKNIMAGGGGPGADEKWNIDDLSYERYLDIYNIDPTIIEANLQSKDATVVAQAQKDNAELNVIKEYFAGNTGPAMAQLAKLQSTDITKEIKDLELLIKKDKHTLSKEEEKDKNVAEYFNMRITGGSTKLELGQLDTYWTIAQNLEGNVKTEDDRARLDSAYKNIELINEDVGFLWANMHGFTDTSPEKLAEYTADYKTLVELSTAEIGPYGKIQGGKPDYNELRNKLDKLWEYYSLPHGGKAKGDIKRKELDETAQSLFGFPDHMTFKDFIVEANEYFARDILAVFEEEEVVLPSGSGSEEEEDNILKGLGL